MSRVSTLLSEAINVAEQFGVFPSNVILGNPVKFGGENGQEPVYKQDIVMDIFSANLAHDAYVVAGLFRDELLARGYEYINCFLQQGGVALDANNLIGAGTYNLYRLIYRVTV